MQAVLAARMCSVMPAARLAHRRDGLPANPILVMPAQAGIQYAVSSEFKRRPHGVLDHPPARMMTMGMMALRDCAIART